MQNRRCGDDNGDQRDHYRVAGSRDPLHGHQDSGRKPRHPGAFPAFGDLENNTSDEQRLKLPSGLAIDQSQNATVSLPF